MRPNECRNQLQLDFTPGHRKNELTSKLADDSIKKSGFKARQSQLVYQAIRNFCNGYTSQEIAAKSEIPNEIVHKRLSILEQNEYIRKGDIRKCRVTGRMVFTWWII